MLAVVLELMTLFVVCVLLWEAVAIRRLLDLRSQKIADVEAKLAALHGRLDELTRRPDA